MNVIGWSFNDPVVTEDVNLIVWSLADPIRNPETLDVMSYLTGRVAHFLDQ